MTLTAEQSSNKAEYEAASTAEIIDIIRTAMSEGCIRPCHVYDAVDELICRIQALENRPKRNCDRFDDLNSAQRHYIEHGCPKGLGMLVDGEIRKAPWKSQFEKWLFSPVPRQKEGVK